MDIAFNFILESQEAERVKKKIFRQILRGGPG